MKDVEVFKNTNFTDILQDIHSNVITKRDSIDSVIAQLTDLVTGINDMVTLAPIIRDFYDVSLKNDDHMVKLATVVQRLMSAEAGAATDDGALSDEEKDRIIANVTADLETIKQGEKILNAELAIVKDRAANAL